MNLWSYISYDIFCCLQLGLRPVAVVQYTFTQNNTQKNTIKQNKHNGTYITTKIPNLQNYVFNMYGAIPIFNQIGQTIWNVRVEIHLRLSVKCVTDSVFTKLMPPPHFFVEKPSCRTSWKSISPGRRWRNGLGLDWTFSFLSHIEILIKTLINCIYLLIWWPKGHTGQSLCKAVGICGAAWGSDFRETRNGWVDLRFCVTWPVWRINYTALSALSLQEYP